MQDAEADLEQIDREQHRDKAIREGAQCPCRKDELRVLGDASRDRPPPFISRLPQSLECHGLARKIQIEAGSSDAFRTARNSLSRSQLNREVRAPGAVWICAIL